MNANSQESWRLTFSFSACDDASAEFLGDWIIAWVEAHGLRVGGRVPFEFGLESAGDDAVPLEIAEALVLAVTREAESKGLKVVGVVSEWPARDDAPLFPLR